MPGSLNRDKHMNVVRGSANSKQLQLSLQRDRSQCVPSLFRFRDQREPILRTEDAMNKIERVCIGHEVVGRDAALAVLERFSPGACAPG
jgi:hypothetical protein